MQAISSLNPKPVSLLKMPELELSLLPRRDSFAYTELKALDLLMSINDNADFRLRK
jgi:hypothetical protein